MSSIVIFYDGVPCVCMHHNPFVLSTDVLDWYADIYGITRSKLSYCIIPLIGNEATLNWRQNHPK